MQHRLHESGLAPLVSVGALDDRVSWSLTARHPPAELRRRLLALGWVEDPFESIRRRTKPFVKWAVREPESGPRLHLEDQDGGLFVHLDVLSPGRHPWLFPGHLIVDYLGWSTTRVRLIRWLARRSRVDT